VDSGEAAQAWFLGQSDCASCGQDRDSGTLILHCLFSKEVWFRLLRMAG